MSSSKTVADFAEFREKMIYRRLGNSGLWVSAISFGTWVNFGVEVEGAGAKELVSAALAAGITFFDTAETYQEGKSETTLGNIFKELGTPRSDIVVATKIFWGGANRSKQTPNDAGCSRKHIIEGTKAALARLQMDYVDVLYCHRRDLHTPIEETVRAMNHVINQGQAFYWGTSEWSAEDIRDAQRIAEKLGMIGPITEQPQYSIIARKHFEVEYSKLFAEGQMGSTVWSPLGGGLLTGKYNGLTRDNLPEGTRLTLERLAWLAPKMIEGETSGIPWEKLQPMLAQLQAIAEKDFSCTQSQLALAWVLANKNVSTAIIGARTLAQLWENLGALNVAARVAANEGDVLGRVDTIFGNKPAGHVDFTRRLPNGALAWH